MDLWHDLQPLHRLSDDRCIETPPQPSTVGKPMTSPRMPGNGGEGSKKKRRKDFACMFEPMYCNLGYSTKDAGKRYIL